METENDINERTFAAMDVATRAHYMVSAMQAARKMRGTAVKGDAACTCDGRKYQVMPDGSWRRLR